MFNQEHKHNVFALDDEAVPLQQQLPLKGPSSSLYAGAGICLTPPSADLSYSLSRKISVFFLLPHINSLTCSPQSQELLRGKWQKGTQV